LVRAFLGEPLLVLLEDPTRGLLASLAPAVLNHAAMTRDRGGAVVWLARSGLAHVDPSFASSGCNSVSRVGAGEAGYMTRLRHTDEITGLLVLVAVLVLIGAISAGRFSGQAVPANLDAAHPVAATGIGGLVSGARSRCWARMPAPSSAL
jgi:hypothetical protein